MSSPPLEWYSRKPVVVLPSQNRRQRRRAASNDRASAAEQGQAGEKDLTAGGTGAPAGEEEEEQDNLDMHVEDVLRKRDRFRRVMRGVWSFVKTRTCTCVWGGLHILTQHLTFQRLG